MIYGSDHLHVSNESNQCSCTPLNSVDCIQVMHCHGMYVHAHTQLERTVSGQNPPQQPGVLSPLGKASASHFHSHSDAHEACAPPPGSTAALSLPSPMTQAKYPHSKARTRAAGWFLRGGRIHQGLPTSRDNTHGHGDKAAQCLGTCSRAVHSFNTGKDHMALLESQSLTVIAPLINLRFYLVTIVSISFHV